MHIEAELDDIHAARLLELHKQTNKPVSEIVAEILAKALDVSALPSGTEEKRQAALAHIAAVQVRWRGKPIEDRDALYDEAIG